MDFRNKTIVVTGGAHGIGRCIAEEFSASGAQVAIIDRTPGNIQEGFCELYFCGDIAEESTLVQFSTLVIEKYGEIDFLVNNACLSRRGILSGCSFDDFLYVQKVGVTAPYFLSLLFKDHFRPDGAIINISSSRAAMSQPDTESYTAAKGGISALTHALAVSLAGRVRVNSIAPGWIDTTGSEWSPEDREQHPVKRVGHPQDIVRLVQFLCSSDAGFMTGENVTVDGGMSRLMIYHHDHGWTFNREN